MENIKKLVVGGDKIDTILFGLAGAKTISMNNSDDLEKVYKYCEENSELIASVLIAGKYFDSENKFLRKISNLNLPVLNINGQSIDDLLEKTIGMKLKKW